MIYGAITSCKVGEKVANFKFSEPKSLDPMFFLETRSFQKFVFFYIGQCFTNSTGMFQTGFTV